MIYIITEDSNSARNFWEHVVDIFIRDGNYILVDSNVWGNTSLEKRTREVIKQAKNGDIVIALFDNIEARNNFAPKVYIDNMLRLCSRKGIEFRYSEYYCFEEIFLSYGELLRISNSKSIEILKRVHDGIHAGINYFKLNYKGVVTDYEKIKGHHIMNREHFADALLTDVTGAITGHFSIHKSGKPFNDIAECWVKSCWVVQLSKLNREDTSMSYVCCKCKYCCKGKEKNEKIKHLNINIKI